MAGASQVKYSKGEGSRKVKILMEGVSKMKHSKRERSRKVTYTKLTKQDLFHNYLNSGTEFTPYGSNVGF